MAGFEVKIKLTKADEKTDLQKIAQQLANVLESLTGRRTVVYVREVTGGRVSK